MTRSLLAVLVALALSGCANREIRGEAVATCPSASTPRGTSEAPMGFFDLIAARHSVRNFTSERVSDDMIRRIVAAANRAPSAGNQQAYEIVVVRSADTKRRLAAAASGQRFVEDAPLVLVFLAHPARNAERYAERGARLYSLQDATLAAAYAQLAVQAQGLASVWVGAVDDDVVLRAVAAPAGMAFSSLLVIGHPAEAPPPTPRRAVEDLMHDERVRAR